jgi:hypothetical protein
MKTSLGGLHWPQGGESKDKVLGRRISGAAFAAPLLCCASLAIALASASPSLATTGHSYAGQFGAAGPGDGEFSGGPGGIAVWQSTGDVLAVDSGHTLPDGTPAPRIERFDATGAFQSAFSIDPSVMSYSTGIAIDPAGAGSVYVSGTDPVTGGGVVGKYSAAGVAVHLLDVGTSATTINANAAIAVDPANGTVYATATDGATSAQVVDSFDQSTGAFIASFNGASGGGFGCPSSLAVDAAHRLYVADGCTNRVDRYDAAGLYQATVDDGSNGSVATVGVDPTSGEAFVGENGTAGGQIAYYTAAGAVRLTTFGLPRIASFGGLAVNHASGSVYNADPAIAVVERFAAFAGPTVATSAGASVDPTTETLSGTINPNGTASTYHFDYGADQNYGTSTSSQPAGGGTVAITASDTASGLQPNTTYHFRIVGSNASGSIVGADRTFTTAPAAPTVDGAPGFASSITTTGATLNGTVNANGSQTAFHFEYGTTTAYGATAPAPDGDAGTAQGDASVSAPVTGLAPATTYHFRLVADNGTDGPQQGADQTFTTASAAAPGATDITASTANLTGTASPGGAPTTYRFDYGPTTAYGKSAPVADAGSSEVTVSQAVKDLVPATTYHVRLVATNTITGVTTTSDDGTFTTAPAAATTATDATGVTTDHATLNGVIDTHGPSGSYRFRVSSSRSLYTSTTPEQALGAADGARAVSASVSDLVPGETYLVELEVTSNGATATSDQVTFSTAPLLPGTLEPPVVTTGTPYGCVAPKIDAYNLHPKAGTTIRFTGSDLGVGGTVQLGTTRLVPTRWAASGFSVDLPDDATGTLPLAVNCGNSSNTIAIQIATPPKNTFTQKVITKGSTATLKLTLPGPGDVTATGASLKTVSVHVSKQGVKAVKVTLTAKAKRSLARHRKLTVATRVTFRPTGGAAAAKIVSLTFRR